MLVETHCEQVQGVSKKFVDWRARAMRLARAMVVHDVASPASDPAAGREAPAVLPVEEDEAASGMSLLEDIETAALAVYARHGLPTRSGHYARSRRRAAWKFLGESLTPEERWALVLAQDQKAGARFARIEELGALTSEDPELIWASNILERCARLRSLVALSSSPDLAGALEVAIGLGAEWRSHESGQILRAHQPLRLRAPENESPVANRKTGKRK